MKYTVSPHVHYQCLDGEVVILDDRAGKYLGLNKSGAVIWQVLAEGGSSEDGVQALVETYSISPERSEADVRQLISELVENNLLQPSGQ
jgi:glutamate synthase domain-containing protein 3